MIPGAVFWLRASNKDTAIAADSPSKLLTRAFWNAVRTLSETSEAASVVPSQADSSRARSSAAPTISGIDQAVPDAKEVCTRSATFPIATRDIQAKRLSVR